MSRSLFRFGKPDIWSELSRELGGQYRSGGLFRSGKLMVPYRDWQITVDEYTVHVSPITLMFVRLRAPVLNPHRFRFRIYKKSGFSWIGKLLGVQDIQIGDQDFDEKFIVQGHPRSLVTRLLVNRRIKDLMACQRDVLVEIRHDWRWFRKRLPEGVEEIHIRAGGTIYQTALVYELFELFSTAIDELCLLGLSAPAKPSPHEALR